MALRLFSLVCIIFFTHFAGADDFTVHVTKGRLEAFPIAIPDMTGSPRAKEISDIIKANLTRSGIFRIIDPRAYIQNAESLAEKIRFSDWRLINAKALVVGELESSLDGFKMRFKLYDTAAERKLEGMDKEFKVDDFRKIAHTISDKIYERLIGITGYFNTKIMYVAETGPINNTLKRLAIMDQDGHNQKFLTNGRRGMIITPRFCPTRPEVTYMAYYEKKPRVYMMNLNTGREQLLGDYPGMTYAPRYSLDGKKLAMSYAHNGVSQVCVMELDSRKVRKITNNYSINTSPSFSPDASKIAFNSDRGGAPQLYVMNSDGSDVKRISFGQGRYATPVWSPRGDLIAFTKIYKKKFYIGVMRPDGSHERLLTKGDYIVEGPEWAPNGRLLTYFRQQPANSRGFAKVNIFTIHLSGDHERLITTSTDASDPSWSPLIP
jgi:TolB protein